MHRFDFLRAARSAAILALTLSVACGGSPPDQHMTNQDGGGGGGGLAVGAACTSDSECGGGDPWCSSGLYPLATLTDDPGLQSIGVALPGGYCSSQPSCSSNADCGEGGVCFQPLADVSASTLASLSNALPGIDINIFASYGACLAPCTDNSACREGYICATPIGSLLGLVEGARLDKYCIGKDAESGCGVCAANSTCNTNTMNCVCDPGFMADGNSCVAGSSPCDADPCMNGGACVVAGTSYTCSCAGGFSGTNCETPVDGCDDGPCQHGSCVSGVAGAYTCTCDAGYMGENCDLAVTCPAPTNPANGKVAAPNRTYGYSAIYACNYGYALTGSATRLCDETGNWADTEPTCTPVDCGAPAAPTSNGTVAAPTTTFGATATYSCSSDYFAIGATTRTCQADGTWSGDVPSCVDDPCMPSNPCSGGTCEPDSTTGAAVCTKSTFSCINGLNPCLNGGTCTNFVCACPTGYTGADCGTIADCGYIADPANGTILYNTNTKYGSTATTACDAGHAPSGGTTRTCQANGTWSGLATTCLPASCDTADLGTLDGGSVAAPAGSKVTQSATYACDPGSQINGDETRVCQSDLTWSGSAPTCSVIDCGALTNPTNGTVATPNGTGYGSTATYACSGDYGVVGATTRTCGSDGTWSGSEPTCELTKCRLTYRFAAPAPTGSRFRIQPSASATTVDIGPGTMVVRVPRDAQGKPAAGNVELLYYDMDQVFGPVSGVSTETRVCLLAPGTTSAPAVSTASTPPEQDAQPGCIPADNSTTMALGTLTLGGTAGTGTMAFDCYNPYPMSSEYTPAQATGTGPGCIRTWFGYGRVKCASGQPCAFAVSPQDVWLDRSGLWSQHFIAPISLASNFSTLAMGNPAGGATATAWCHVPNNDNGWTGFALVGTLDAAASTCTP